MHGAHARAHHGAAGGVDGRRAGADEVGAFGVLRGGAAGRADEHEQAANHGGDSEGGPARCPGRLGSPLAHLAQLSPTNREREGVRRADCARALPASARPPAGVRLVPGHRDTLPRMAAVPPALKRLRAICLALPDTKETPTWGNPHFRVGEKIFAGYGDEDGRALIGFKLTLEHQAAAIDGGRFFKAKYVGKSGWVSTEADCVRDWDELAGMVLESYRLIAPKRLVATLDGAPAHEARKPAPRRARPHRKA